MDQYNVLVLLPDKDRLHSQVPALISVLENAGSTEIGVQANSDGVENIIRGLWGEWALFLSYSEASYLLQEAQEIAENYASQRSDREVITRCRTRIDLWSDADPEMRHFNDYVGVLEQLEIEFPTAILFDAANEAFL